MPAPAPAKPAPPLLGRLRRAYGSCRLPPAGHRDPQLLLSRVRRVLADDLSLVDDEDPVGQRENLFELERDEQHTDARVALLDQPPVHELDRADVETARRLRGDQDARVA